MAKLDDLIEDLVTANHVLAKYGIVDSFGHVSIRHPTGRTVSSCRARALPSGQARRHRRVQSRLRAIDAKGKHLYTERPIHGGAYQARPDVMS
jgi:HCOMODA/2-hydroxy-3-carboxy-muconic semialdehyde decarboxylase